MPKLIADLNDAMASRARKDDLPREPERPRETEPVAPRLADRIIALKPLTEQPMSVEPDPEPDPAEETAQALLKLADSPRFQRGPGGAAHDHLSPGNALVVYRNAVVPGRSPLVGENIPQRASGETRGAQMADGRALAAFVIGLIIATAIGIGLYARLV